MNISRDAIADVIEKFIRTEYQVSEKDRAFTREAHLFEMGFLDSLGFTELIAFVETRFEIGLDDAQLFSEDFTTINGMSGIIQSLLSESRLEPTSVRADNGVNE